MDNNFIYNAEEDNLEDFIDLKFKIENPHSLKYSSDEIDSRFNFENVLLPNAKYKACVLINEGVGVDDVVFGIGMDNKIEPNSLKTELIDDGYLVEGLNRDDLKSKYENYNPKQLKKILKKHKLKRSGSKEELIERLAENIPEDEIPFDTYKLTPKAHELLEDEERLLFIELLTRYIYEEFKEYYPEGDFFTNVFDFLEKHRSLAIEREDHFAFVDSCVFNAGVLMYTDDYSKALYWIIARFIFGINYIFLDSKYYPTYAPIDSDSCDILHTIGKECTMKDVKNTFDKVYEELDFEYKVPKEITRQIVENVVNDVEINNILYDLGKYYMEHSNE